MDIVADESVDYAIIQSLREIGFKVFSILEQAPGISDKEVLSVANRHKCLLITEDKDFGELTHRLNKKHHGILLIRIINIPRYERILMVTELVRENLKILTNNFSVLSEHGIRIKGNVKK